MIELPESYVLAEQIEYTLVGKTIVSAIANANHHAFAWYTGDPMMYGAKLSGKMVARTNIDNDSCGSCVEIVCDDMLLSISTPIKYHAPGEKLPKSHQLLLKFNDESHMSCTVQMWGNMRCFLLEEKEDEMQVPSPLADSFNDAYFDNLLSGVKQSLSAKAFLATEQRIPGLGNGVLQDILFNARIHPKSKLNTLSDEDKEQMFHSVKHTLKEMKECGGRDTEKDLFNHNGRYRTILSKNTLLQPCYVCGGVLTRKAFLGGNIYFCAQCQPLKG